MNALRLLLPLLLLAATDTWAQEPPAPTDGTPADTTAAVPHPPTSALQPAEVPPLTEEAATREERWLARETTQERASATIDTSLQELQELLRRLPDTLPAERWIPGSLMVGGVLMLPLRPRRTTITMVQRGPFQPVDNSFARRIVYTWVAISNGQAFNWQYGNRLWGYGTIYPGSYLDARTLSFPLPRP